MKTAAAETEVLLEWTYSPRDFFESEIEVARSDYTVNIPSSAISTRLRAFEFDADDGIRQRLHDALFDLMCGVQLVTRKPFQLSKSRLTRIEPDGRRHIFVEPEGAVLTLSGFPVDTTVTDASVKVIADSKQERINGKAELAELVAKYSPEDDLLKSMLQSYSTSVSDPNNELFHLYEVRDALSTAFGGEAKAREALNISRDAWSRFGQLCNDEPLRQGRHRGKNFESRRDASEAELREGRAAALAMINAYLSFRERGGKVK